MKAKRLALEQPIAAGEPTSFVSRSRMMSTNSLDHHGPAALSRAIAHGLVSDPGLRESYESHTR